MKKKNLNVIIDALSFACFTFLVSTGVIIHYLLPSGSGRWRSIWSLNRHQWGTIHFWIAVIFLGVLTIHLALHWRWIVSILKGGSRTSSGYRLVLGIVGALAILALAAAPLLTGVKESNEVRGQGQHRAIK